MSYVLKALAEELWKDAIRFSCRIVSIVTQAQQGSSSSIAIIHMGDGTTIKAKALIGWDGVHSVVARRLGLTAAVNSGRWAAHGLSVSPHGQGLNYEFLQFMIGDKKAGFVPLNDKELYWFLFCKFTPKGKDMRGNAKLILREVLENYAKDLPQINSTIVNMGSGSVWVSMDIVFRNVGKGKITVAGDAMHPMTPDLGQNECPALEHAVALGQQFGELITQSQGLVPGQVVKALRRYARQRRWRAVGLMTMSYLSSFGYTVQKASVQ